MKLDPKFKPELCASTDLERWNLTTPYLDRAANKVVATDGYRLVVVPATVEEGDTAQHLVQEDLDRARRPNAAEVPPPSRDRGRFPDWPQVVPPFRRGSPNTATVGLNARYLYEIAQAIGSADDQVAITFDPEQVNDGVPVLVQADSNPAEGDAFGVLMPLRLKPVADPPSETKEQKVVRLRKRWAWLLDEASGVEDQLQDLGVDAATGEPLPEPAKDEAEVARG